MTEIIKLKKIMVSPKQYHIYLNYHDALLYCSMLDIDGYDNWQLPDSDDMSSIDAQGKIIDDTKRYWLINKSVRFPNGIKSPINNENLLVWPLTIIPIRKILQSD